MPKRARTERDQRTHSIVLLGSSVPSDGWMLSDANKLAWAMAEVKGYSGFFAPLAPEKYNGSTDDGYIVGEPDTDRLLIPHPTRNVEIFDKPLGLKKAFLDKVEIVAKKMHAKDVLFVAFSSHGRCTDGAIVVGDILSAARGCDFITREEFRHAIRDKPASARVVLWVSTCHSGFWLEKKSPNDTKDWETLAAARPSGQSQSFPLSPSGHYRGGMQVFSTFIAHGQNGVVCPFSVGPDTHYFVEESPLFPLDPAPHQSILDLANESTSLMKGFRGNEHHQHVCALPSHRPLPLPAFKSAALARLRLVPYQPASPSGRIKGGGSHFSESLSMTMKNAPLTTAFSHAQKTRSRPSTPFIVILSRLITTFNEPDADPLVDAALFIHVVGYLEYQLFLADAMALTGTWPCSGAVTGAADQPNLDFDLLYSQHPTVPSLDDLCNTLGTDDDHCDKNGMTWSFSWRPLVLTRFWRSWHHADCPSFTISQVVDARREVVEKMTSLLQGQPGFFCHCTLHHPNLTASEYTAHLRWWRDEKQKEQLLTPLILGPLPSLPVNSPSPSSPANYPSSSCLAWSPHTGVCGTDFATITHSVSLDLLRSTNFAQRAFKILPHPTWCRDKAGQP